MTLNVVVLLTKELCVMNVQYPAHANHRGMFTSDVRRGKCQNSAWQEKLGDCERLQGHNFLLDVICGWVRNATKDIEQSGGGEGLSLGDSSILSHVNLL